MNRIVILGASGTGKTTLCRKIGEKRHLEVLHLDSIYWKKNWQNIDKHDFDVFMKNFFMTHQQWVIDGNYTNNAHFNYRLELADTIIYLDFGLQVSLKGIFERANQYKHRNRSDMAEGCIEGIDQEFLHYVSTFKNKGQKIKAIIKKYENKKNILVFHSRDELNVWLNAL
ncbi:MAG: AAA family ATPase [Bacilli bacterium]|nr:AAA family ATPase [Bacilli bacterium]